ncbi:PDZ and LIM domain protein 4-like isoform X1 [Paramormyrops kingsleyae]|uniref:PDZ and LIM domain protein 4 n=2 Tax=Paramormyrops kingsleyae TaxID=1676925 RepID=A0A3B3R7V8_9TELE|nr:PDZ and LIM domain protein 4-like isoform X2 [Paramormyrops kingsleyae]
MSKTVILNGPAPWGFRLVGGRDFSTPLTISKITSGSKAEQAKLKLGDVILAINGDSTESMNHMEAQNRIKGSSDHLALDISRSKETSGSPLVTEDDKTKPCDVMESESKNFRPIGSGCHGKVAQNGPDVTLCSRNSRLPPQCNSPAGLYSHGSSGLPKQMADLSLSSQSDGTFNGESDVFKMLQEPEEPPMAPKQSGSFLYLQGMLEAEEGGRLPRGQLAGGTKSSVRSPVPHLSPKPSVQPLPQCTRCAKNIVGVIVKARDNLYHSECFLCDDCGMNLKKKGYFIIEESLYCETHAKARVQPPEGYDVVAVYPNAKV